MSQALKLAKNRILLALLLLVFIYLLFAQINSIWSFTIDDAYITLRYAKNWASGLGLVWNPKAPPVEGYSNFSFVALAAMIIQFHGDPVIVFKIFGVLGLLVTSIFLFLITRFWFPWQGPIIQPSNIMVFLPSILLLVYRGEIIWSVSGLETTTYQALLCATVYYIFRGLGYCAYPGARNSVQLKFIILAALIITLAGITRPEAPVLAFVFFLLIFWEQPKAARIFLITLCFSFLPYFLWRWHYYGYFLPNSLYCKAFDAKPWLLDKSYLKLIAPWIFLGLPIFLKLSDKRLYYLWLPSLVYLILLSHADPIVAFDNRLFLPVFALFLPLPVIGLSILLDTLAWKYKELIQIIILSVAGIFFMPWLSLSDYRYFSKAPRAGEHLRREVVQWLNQHIGVKDTVVLSDAGLIPYLSSLKFIDSYCLNNLEIAHDSAKDRYSNFCYKTLRDKKEVLILTSLIEHGKIQYTPSDFCLKKLLIGNNSYKLQGVWSTQKANSVYQYEVFRKV